MKFLKKLIVLFGFFLLFSIFNLAQPAKAEGNDNSALIKKLSDACYSKYKSDYDDQISKISVTNSDYYAGKGDADFQADIDEAKESYQKLATINIDLLKCYRENVGSDEVAKAKIATFLADAEKEYSQIESFDFKKLLSADSKASDTIKIPAKSKKYFRLRTYCLDSKRGAPEAGEEFYLVGNVDTLRPGLCQLLKEGKNQYLKEIQDKVWASENGANSESKTDNKNSDSTLFDWIEDTNYKNPIIFGSAGLLFLLSILFLVLAIKGQSRTGKIIEYIIFVFLVLGSIAIMLYGISSLIDGNTTSSDSATKDNDLLDLKNSGDISFRAISAGRMKEIDLTIENFTDKDFTVNTECLLLTPKSSKADLKISALFDQIIPKAKASTSGMTSQKLGTSGAVADGPPIPSAPTAPGDLFGELKQIASTKVRAAMLDFKENPNNDTLRTLLDAISLCQQTSCGSEDSAMKEAVEIWQKVLDQATSDYNSNKSADNKEKLERATEICQYIGCNSQKAEEALGI